MSISADKLYKLLPSVYRIRDDEMGGPLKALVSVIAEAAIATEDNIAELYENWFIETCKEWVVPYIGDLMGVRTLHTIPGSGAISQRAYVANTISYRRRKGIAPVLEQLAMDTTGWRAHVTEYFELLIASQYMNHNRLKCLSAPDLRQMNQLDLVNGPFDTICHSVDVRHISNGTGKYNIPNIGLAVWRIQNYPVILSDPAAIACVADPGAAFFTFDPTGSDLQLFNEPKTETAITHISTETNVPALLRRRALFDELEARRQSLVDGNPIQYGFFYDRESIEGDPASRKRTVFEIYTSTSAEPIPPEEILICNLETCCKPPANKTYLKIAPDGSFTLIVKPITVAADPVSGRFLFTNPAFAKNVQVSYSYGFSGDTGAGPYNRQDAYNDFLNSLSDTEKASIWHRGVSATLLPAGTEKIDKKLADAIKAWNLLPDGSIGIISIIDSATYAGNIKINIKEKSRLLIIAAEWPLRADPNDPVAAPQRFTADLAAGDVRPLIKGNVTVTGTTATALKTGGSLLLNGLLIAGKMAIAAGNLNALNMGSSTLIPSFGGLEVKTVAGDTAPNQWLDISMYRCITGFVNLNDAELESFSATDCIIDCRIKKASDRAIDAVNVPINLAGSTVFGKTHAKSIEAGNCIFTDTVKAERRQTGCIRYSYVPGQNAETPRRYRCQPELEVNRQISELSTPPSPTHIKNIWDFTMTWLVPGFTSRDYGQYGYAQLARNCTPLISAGADDGAEMGAFYYLKQPQRKANLQITLEEYLSLGLEAGILFVT